MGSTRTHLYPVISFSEGCRSNELLPRNPEGSLAWGVVFAVLFVFAPTFGAVTQVRAQFGSQDIQRVERTCDVQVIRSDELEQALQAEARKGYDITAAPNQGRLIAGVLLRLAQERRSRRPDGPPFLIRQHELFPAFLRVTGLAVEEVPPSARDGRRYGVAFVVEYRADRVIRAIEAGPEPNQALAVRATWPEERSSSYAYEDTASVPTVRVRHHQQMTYRLLEYDDLVVYDKMKGVAVQPTSGALGALFSVLGMADIKQTRHVIADDGTQVTLARVDKMLTTEALATVDTSGRAQRGLPEDRPKLEPLKERIERHLSVQYGVDPPSVCPNESEQDV